jgi:hypothetical protein
MSNKSIKSFFYLPLFGILFLCSPNLLAQQVAEEFQEPCGQVDLLKQLENKYPGFKQQYDKDYLQSIKRSATVGKRKRFIKDTTYYYDTIYTVRVVFHVLYNNAAENIHDSLLKNQIEVLNQDFRRLNSDSFKTRNVFKTRAGDTRIEFELATVDPSGNPTTGIVRKATSVTSWGTANGISENMKYDAVGGSNAWDPKKYLNIWVCDMTFQNQDRILGFAYPPYGHPSWPSSSWTQDPNQGVVLHYKVTGRNNPRSTGAALGTSNKGRVAVHEVGHYFGLRHIWADDQFSANRCLLDDYIDDTPLQGVGANFTCNLTQNTCWSGQDDLPDMIENYMDYSTHDCQNLFTRQQCQVMRAALVDSRPGIISRTRIEERMRIFDTTIFDKILIYPVNSEDKIVVEITDEDLKDQLSVEVYNSIGQQVVKNQLLTKNETELRPLRHSTGVYIVVLRKSNGDHDLLGDPIRKDKIFLD